MTKIENNYNYDSYNLTELSTNLKIVFKGDGEEILEYKIPCSKYVRDAVDSYFLEFNLEGVFWTKKSAEFLNDILLRFNLSFDVRNVTVKVVPKPYDLLQLSDFQGLKSIKKKIFIPRANKYEDSVFWGLKLFVEHYLKESSFISYSTLFSYADTHYHDHVKERSTLKAKCRSIWNYYNERDFKSDSYKRKCTDEEHNMTRSENIKRVHKLRILNSKNNIINLITGINSDKYKKKSGSWNYGEIAKVLKISRNTVSKYIKEYELESDD